jgi:hypothetical protein
MITIDHDKIAQMYLSGKPIMEIAFEIGCSRSSVHNSINKQGLKKRVDQWSEQEVSILRAAYEQDPVAPIDLDEIAARIGRPRMSVALKASELGITGSNGIRTKYRDMSHLPAKKRVQLARRKTKTDEELKELKSKISKEAIAKNGHPRGMLGKNHSLEARENMSDTRIKAWKAIPKSRKQELLMKQLKSRLANQGTLVPNNREKTTWKAAWREIGGIKKYYRSRWEANYARYLEWMRSRGEIAKWEHEPETFWFSGVKRGTVSYLPDFRVTKNDGSIYYVEVKGWMDDRSKTKLKRMKKYHPSVQLELVDGKRYNAIKKVAQKLIADWE